MGLLSSICSSVGSFVSNAVSSFGGAIGAAVSAINPVLGMGISVISKVANIAQGVMHGLGLFRPNENTEEMGDRMIQAAANGIKPEGYDKFDDYMAEIRSRNLDPEKSKETPLEVKQSAGIALSTMALEDKFKGTANIADIWSIYAKNPDYFTADKLTSILSTFKDIKSIVDYFDGKAPVKEAMATEKSLIDIEKAASPNRDDKGIADELRKL